MNNGEFGEEQLKESLRKMPKITDHRHPQEIWNKINESRSARRKRKTYVFPAIATIGAVILFAAIALNVFDFEQMTTEKDSLNNGEAGMTAMEEEKAEIVPEEGEKIHLFSENAKSNDDENFKYTAVYEEERKGREVFTFQIPDKEARMLIPVSITVPEDGSTTEFEQFLSYMNDLDENELGLIDYYPLQAKLNRSGANTLLVDVPANHPYGTGSSSEFVFQEVIARIASDFGMAKVQFFTEGTPGIEFGNSGILYELNVSDQFNRGYLLYYPDESAENPFLVPSMRSYETIETAIDAMQAGDKDNGLEPSIPNGFIIDHVEIPNNELVVLSLNDKTVVENEHSFALAIEAIMLTAKDFQFKKVKIESSTIGGIGKFTFNEEWDVPVAPNNMDVYK